MKTTGAVQLGITKNWLATRFVFIAGWQNERFIFERRLPPDIINFFKKCPKNAGQILRQKFLFAPKHDNYANF